MLSITRPQRKKTHALNLTPLIDVIFLLIVFFMLTSKFALDRVIDLSLASVSTQEVSTARAGNTVLIILETSNQFSFWSEDGSKSSQPFSVNSLKETITPLIKGKKNRPIVVVTSLSNTAQDVVNALTYLRQAGATNIQLASSGE